MARKPITVAHMEPSIDKSNLIAIQKRFTYEAWDELVNTPFSVTTTGTAFALSITWQELKSNYAEVYFSVGGANSNHTIIIPTDMIGKVNVNSAFNLASGIDAFMVVTLGSLGDKTGTIKSTVNYNSTRLIILAR